VTNVVYYTSTSGENPVKRFLESLQKLQKAKIFRIFQNVEAYGLSTALPHIKKLSGTPLWEIRILGQDNIRILYVTVHQNSILLLHGFVKKTQKTPNKEINTALKRLREYRIKLD
jgi:phage-related protein